MTLKLIQVFVADPDGNPAADLEKADFVLYDNGNPQKITDFEKHFLRTPEAVVAGQAVSEAPAAPSPLMKGKYILLFDNDSNDLAGINKSRQAALQFLTTDCPLGRRTGSFSCSPISGLTVDEYFTSDHQQIREAISKIKSEPGAALGGLAVESFAEHELANPEHPTLDGMFSFFKDFDSGANRRPYGRRDFIVRLTELAKALRQVDGQKNIILFSREFRHIMDSPLDPDAVRFREMAKELASANCPVFVVNTAGGIDRTMSPNAGLSYLSNITGGRYYDAVDHYAENARSIRNVTSNYYVLGYPVGSSWDGKFHKIEVEVRRKGYETFGQKGYFNPVPFNKLSAMEKSLHLIDVALGEDPYFGQPIDFPLAVLPYSDESGTNYAPSLLDPGQDNARKGREKNGGRQPRFGCGQEHRRRPSRGSGLEDSRRGNTLASIQPRPLPPAATRPGSSSGISKRAARRSAPARSKCPEPRPRPQALPAAFRRLVPLDLVRQFLGRRYRQGRTELLACAGVSLSDPEVLSGARGVGGGQRGVPGGAEVRAEGLRCTGLPGPGRARDSGRRTIDPAQGQSPRQVEREDLLFLILEFRAPAPLAAGPYTLSVVVENQQTGVRAMTLSDLNVKQGEIFR